MNISFFSDLDDTLLQSTRKVPEGMASTPISTNREGEYIGEATESQLLLKDMMESQGWLIPVTGRNKDALYRIKWNWKSYQAVSHGAIVLNQNGTVNEDWIEEIAKEVEAAEPILKELNAKIELMTKDTSIDTKVLYDQLIPVYISVKERDEEGCIKESLAQVVAMELPEGWRVHLNGRNMAVLPPYASKARAVRFIKNLLGKESHVLSIGLGDSISDIEFMNECDFIVIPKVSQINKVLTKLKLLGE